MRVQYFLGAVTASALVGFGALAGSVVGGAFAQAPTGTNAAQAVQAVATPAPVTPAPGNGKQPGGAGGRGGHFRGPGPGGGNFFRGKGPGGFGERGFGGRSATDDTANNEISRAGNVITTAKSDLAYANGKMDTTNLTNWLNSADSAITSAKAAVTATQFGRAGEYAQAASQLAQLAEQQMGQTLGFDKLPSASQRPQHPNRGAQTAPTVSQAQASRVLAQTYSNLVAQGALIKGGSSEATSYLADAQNAYKAGYSAYGSGKYQDAVNSARLAEQLSGIASTLNRAATDTTTGTDTPVQVPAPNF